MTGMRDLTSSTRSLLSSLPQLPVPLPLALGVCFLFAIIVPLFLWQGALKKQSAALQGKTAELKSLAAEFGPVKARIDDLERRKSGAKSTGVAQALEDLTGALGLKAKMKSVKALGTKEIADGIEESAEVTVEKVTMNELVNILYKIEEAPVMLSLRRVAVKKTFENPELLNATLTLSLFSRK
jgi:general secretion pathway protein M